MRRLNLISIAMLAVGIPLNAGPFHLSDSSLFDPFIVVHPPGYDGTGGTLEVRICAAEETRFAVLKAISIWNAAQRTTENCTACRLWEEGPSGSGEPFSMESTVLHEMGHCVLGLGHINWNDGSSETSFTNTADATLMTPGADGIRGSSDDGVAPLPGARLIHWFRETDNNPLTIDSTTIDSATYTRRIIDLPTGHGWSANGNRGVGLPLGFANTQAIMYSGIDAGQAYNSLAADEVNTVEFGMSGLDEDAGTADDYTIELIYVDDCAAADVEVQYFSFGMGSMN